jgi:hypothetical protein
VCPEGPHELQGVAEIKTLSFMATFGCGLMKLGVDFAGVHHHI